MPRDPLFASALVKVIRPQKEAISERELLTFAAFSWNQADCCQKDGEIRLDLRRSS
jgi:hypothetical protein